MKELPSDLPTRLVTMIRVGLLRIHSKKLEGADMVLCLRESYDVCATAFRDDGQELDTDLLCERIPTLVFHWAVAKKWLQYPLSTPRIKGFVTPSGYVIEETEFVPIPDSQLDVVLGEHKITQQCKAVLIEHLSGRIAYWQSEALTPRPNKDGAQYRITAASIETTSAQLNRLREECDITVEELAEAIDLEVRSVYRHLSGEVTPYNRNRQAYQRVFSKLLKRDVVIKKMS